MAKKRINWLLLRGLTREKSHWGLFLPILKQNFPESQIFCLDFPGVGTENSIPSPLSIAGITDAVRRRWQKNYSKDKMGDWICVGHSLGGMVALDWQDRFAKDFIGVVAMNTSSRSLCNVFQRVQPKALVSFVKIATAKYMEDREKCMLELVSNKHGSDPSILAEWISYAKERPMLPSTPFRQSIAAFGFKAKKKNKVPLLFLSSEADRLAHPVCSKKLAKLYKSNNIIHKSAGHDLTMDDPAWVIENFKKFAKELYSNGFENK